jgi:SCP-2 sterol transfer family
MRSVRVPADTPISVAWARRPGGTVQTMATYPFLSEEWIEAAHAIREEYRGRTAPPPLAVRMNQVITGVPFGEGTIRSHLDTTDGDVEIALGHLEKPDVTVTLDYDTAKALLVEQDAQAGMQAFMAGRIMVQGDMSKLLALQQPGSADPAAREAAARIKEITA